MNNIQAVLFDYGGVLAEEGFSAILQALAREQSLEVGDMIQEGVHAVYDSGFVLGTGSEADFWALLSERTGLRGDFADHRARMLEAFALRPWMLDLVDRLRREGRIAGILSDQTDWLERLDARDHFFEHFDCVYNSYYLGKGKRDPSHFTDVAADLGLEPSVVLFVDDARANVERAIAVGMQAIWYVDRDSFLREMKEKGVI